jgi:hypothetical protein
VVLTHTAIGFMNTENIFQDKGKTIVGCEVLDPEYFTKVEIFGYVIAEEAMTPEFVDPTIDGWRYPTNLLLHINPPSWLAVSLID